MKWYLARRSFKGEITTVQVEKATEQSVWIEGRRRARMLSDEAYFPTWPEAKTWLVDRTTAELARLVASQARVQGRLDHCQALTEANDDATS